MIENIKQLLNNKGNKILEYSNFNTKNNKISRHDLEELIKNNKNKIIYYRGVWNNAENNGNFIDNKKALDIINTNIIDMWFYDNVIILRAASNGDLF